MLGLTVQFHPEANRVDGGLKASIRSEKKEVNLSNSRNLLFCFPSIPRPTILETGWLHKRCPIHLYLQAGGLNGKSLSRVRRESDSFPRRLEFSSIPISFHRDSTVGRNLFIGELNIYTQVYQSGSKVEKQKKESKGGRVWRLCTSEPGPKSYSVGVIGLLEDLRVAGHPLEGLIHGDQFDRL